MAPVLAHLSQGKNPSVSAQLAVVENHYRDLRKYISSLFLLVYDLKKKEARGYLLTETDNEKVSRRWKSVTELHHNTSRLRIDWTLLQVKGKFPEWTPKDRYDFALMFIGEFVAKHRIDTSQLAIRSPKSVRFSAMALETSGQSLSTFNDFPSTSATAMGSSVRSNISFSPKIDRDLSYVSVRPSTPWVPLGVPEPMSFSHVPSRIAANLQSPLYLQMLSEFDWKMFWEIPNFSGKHLDFAEFFELFCLLVHYTKLDDIFKLNCLRIKLDPRSRKMIKYYTGQEYNKALQVIINEYTAFVTIISHVEKRALELPVVYKDDLVSFSNTIEQLRSINNLFGLYQLSSGFEMKIFRIFLSKIPLEFSERYLRRLRNGVPSLDLYLHYLDKTLVALRTKDLWFAENVPDVFPAQVSQNQLEQNDEMSSGECDHFDFEFEECPENSPCEQVDDRHYQLNTVPKPVDQLSDSFASLSVSGNSDDTASEALSESDN